MDKTAFARAVTQAAYRKVGDGILDHWAHPVGRGQRQMKQARADWIATLDDPSRAMLRDLVDEAVHAGVFGVLCVLDGVRAIEDGPERGGLTLTHHDADGRVTQLNAEAGEMLHDLFNGFSREEG